MNEKQAKALALRFLEAVTTADVDKVIKSEPAFAATDNWRPYGGVDKNWDRVNVQTSDPVGALAELIINSVDAILMRKADELGVSENDADCPKNMQEAVGRFFPDVIDGRLMNIDPRHRTKLAEASILVGVKRPSKKYLFPTYTVIDYGEGQHPENFDKTMLSLGEKNKEGIPYVQGRFNMGSTGSIVFCTRGDIFKGHYKFVLSRRNRKNDHDGPWGWTLIRVRRAAQGEKLPVAEYFSPDGVIPSFAPGQIQSLGRDDIGLIDGGTVVKMYEYDIGPSARTVDFGLRQALATSLLECALPVRIYDFNATPDKKRSALRSAGIADSTFSGMNITFHGIGEDTNEDDAASEEKGGDGKSDALEFSQMIADNSEDADLGRIRIHGFGLWKMPDYLKNHRRKHRVFYTVNGQSQAWERASFYRRAKLDDLRNHLVVQVDCDLMDPTARSTIFKPDRERKSDTEITRKLESIVVNSLKESGKLREFANEIRKRRVTEEIDSDERSRDLFQSIVNNSPDLQELLGIGEQILDESSDPGTDKYEGKKFPTYLKPMDKQLLGDGIKEIPANTYRRIPCVTDAANDYLSREKDRGTFLCPDANIIGNKASLRDGKLTITVSPPPNAYVGQEIEAEFGFSDPNCLHNPLVFTAKIKVVSPEKTGVKPPSPTPPDRKKSPALNFPKFHWVRKQDWSEFDFNDMSGAAIRESDGFEIHVNRDNQYLLAALRQEPDESNRLLIERWFQWGVGILTLSIHRKMNPDDDNSNSSGGSARESDSHPDYDTDSACRDASSAIAAHIVTIIKQLGGHDK